MSAPSAERDFEALGAALWAPSRAGHVAVSAFASARYDAVALGTSVDEAAKRALLEQLDAAGLWREGGHDEDSFARFRRLGLRELLALASDGAGVAAARVLAVEAAQRLAPWCPASAARLHWFSSGARNPRAELRLPAQTFWTPVYRALRAAGLFPNYDYELGAALQRLRSALRAGAERAAAARGEPVCVAGLRALTQDAVLAFWWRVAVERALTVPPRRTWKHDESLDTAALRSLEGLPFAALPSPLEPLLDAWGLGYALIVEPGAKSLELALAFR